MTPSNRKIGDHPSLRVARQTLDRLGEMISLVGTPADIWIRAMAERRELFYVLQRVLEVIDEEETEKSMSNVTTDHVHDRMDALKITGADASFMITILAERAPEYVNHALDRLEDHRRS